PPPAGAKPAAVTAHPHRVARFLRELFRRLPPDLRPLATFDTLSAGHPLRALPVRFAGAYSGPVFRGWGLLHAHRLDPPPGADKFDRPPDEALDRLAECWDATP